MYLLYGEPAAGGNQVYIWIGQYTEFAEYANEESCQELARKCASEFKAAMGGWSVGRIAFVRELKEPEEFWDYFVLG